jgi:hypothetical protein
MTVDVRPGTEVPAATRTHEPTPPGPPGDAGAEAAGCTWSSPSACW